MQSWLLFASVAFIATITPGPAILLATSHSMAFGLKRAVFTILGNISGLFIMSALSVAGLSALILSSSTLFATIKFIGALYLIYLGIRLWRTGFTNAVHPKEIGHVPSHRKKLYLQGLAIALSNPKAIAFTTALFPQFLNHEGSLLAQFSILVVTFMGLSFACLLGYAYAAEHTTNKLFSSAPSYVSKLLGAGFIASGVALANATHKPA
jgi:threonine/homoserine/homoserine lactone efflux protein